MLRRLIFHSLHGVGLARACLSVGEDSAVVSLQHSVYKFLDVTTSVNVTLRGVTIEGVVKLEHFVGATVVIHLQMHLLFIGLDGNAAVGVAIPHLRLEEGSDSYPHFDSGTGMLLHMQIIISVSYIY